MRDLKKLHDHIGVTVANPVRDERGVADTVNLDHIKRHYYVTHTEINSTGIVPLGPVLDFNAPHARAKLGD